MQQLFSSLRGLTKGLMICSNGNTCSAQPFCVCVCLFICLFPVSSLHGSHSLPVTSKVPGISRRCEVNSHRAAWCLVKLAVFMLKNILRHHSFIKERTKYCLNSCSWIEEELLLLTYYFIVTMTRKIIKHITEDSQYFSLHSYWDFCLSTGS